MHAPPCTTLRYGQHRGATIPQAQVKAPRTRVSTAAMEQRGFIASCAARRTSKNISKNQSHRT
eukprot:428160-Amphidinium_carterae.1